MKFRDYVGEDVERKVRRRNWNEVIQEDILPEFTKSEERRIILETSIGFGLSKMDLKRVFDYIKSWLIRYDIKHEAVNPYLTVATVEGNYKRDRFIKALKKVKEGHVFEPDGVYILREDNKDFIIIDYIYNHNFVGDINECLSNFKLEKKENTCYVKLFSMEAESFPLYLFDQMIYSLPELPDVEAGSVGLLVRRK